MKTTKQSGFGKPVENESSTRRNYVIIEGKKVSRTWAAALANKGTGTIVDMRAVLK